MARYDPCSQGGVDGAGRVIGIDQHRARLDIASVLGATDCIEASDDPGEVTDAVLRLIPGGVDVVVDATGHPSGFGTALSLLRYGGTCWRSEPLSTSGRSISTRRTFLAATSV